MTNPDNAGGLPELPAPDFMLRWDSMRAAYYVSRPNVGNTDVYTADQMRAYGELCRAAPAGGDYRGVIPQVLDETINGVVSDLEMIAAGKDQVTGDPVSGLQSQRIAKAAHDRLLSAWNACDSAPAGSGEVLTADASTLLRAKIHEWRTDALEIRESDHAHRNLIAEECEAHADELDALLRKLQQGADENSLRAVAKRNLRSLINIGSDDKALMLKCLEELS